MDPFQKEYDRERKEHLETLKQYPCSFQMKDIGLVKTKAFEGLKNHLEEGLKAGYSTSLQTASTRNLLAFAWFQLGERDDQNFQKALDETEKVLEMEDQENNIISLANKAYMLCKLNSFCKAKEVLDELEELRQTPEYAYLLVKAKAELASSYLRFGPRFNKHAVDAFKEVLPQAREPEIWMWKFCLAVTYRHALDLQHAPYTSKGQCIITHRDALQLLQEIIDRMPEEEERSAATNLKANAHAEMGLLLRLTWDKTTEFELCSQAKTGPLACCKKALELDDNDASVLWKAGKLFRNYKDLFRSRKLLDKAVRMQPSSAAYHHLGLTYKAMATNLQYGKLKTRRGGKRHRERKLAREEKMKSQEVESGNAVQRGVAVPVSASGREIRQREKVGRIKKTVKSPDAATQFDPSEQNVQLAIDNLKLAVDFSAGENSRAVYDLALLYKSMENFDDALRLFRSVAQRQNGEITTPSGLLEQITSQEQMGLIYRQMARKTTDEKKKKVLTKKSESELYGAVSLASRLYSSVEDVKDIFGEIFHSPSALLQTADASNQNEVDKRKTKAKIYSLINNTSQLENLLNDMGEKGDAECSKLKIELCMKKENYEEAAALMSCLKPTEQYPKVMKLFKCQRDVHAIFDIFHKAGREALSHGPCTSGYLVEAFRHEIKCPQQSLNDSSNTSGDNPTCLLNNSSNASGDDPKGLQEATVLDTESVKPKPDEPWDIMLLHDEEDYDIEGKAVRLQDILKMSCGLRVIRRNENAPPGTADRISILENIENSRLVVILPGKIDRLLEFEEYVNIAAQRESVVLLTENIEPDAVSQLLIQLHTPIHRSMICPAELFAPDFDVACPQYKEEVVGAISDLFKFLVNRD